MTCAEYFGKKQCLQREQIQNGIDRVLSAWQIEFTCDFIKRVHKEIFCQAHPKIAGVFRQNDVCKREEILLGRSVEYAKASAIQTELEALLQSSPSVAEFVAKLWQIHPFQNGNTRLCAVMAVLCLRKEGFCLDNSKFEQNAKLFRNTLVRASFSCQEIKPDISYLEKFLSDIVLKNDFLKEKNYGK